jgi:hypothetical protein
MVKPSVLLHFLPVSGTGMTGSQEKAVGHPDLRYLAGDPPSRFSAGCSSFRLESSVLAKVYQSNHLCPSLFARGCHWRRSKPHASQAILYVPERLWRDSEWSMGMGTGCNQLGHHWTSIGSRTKYLHPCSSPRFEGCQLQ